MRRRAANPGPGTWLVILLFPGIFIIAGSVAIHAAARNRSWARESVSWPQVPGTIVQTVVSRNGVRTVIYQYAAGGRYFRSSRAAFGSVDSLTANRLSERYAPGQPVPVFVNPDDPSVAVLHPGLQGGNWMLPFFGGMGIVVGLLILRFMIKEMRSG
jgi:hypothetical protein